MEKLLKNEIEHFKKNMFKNVAELQKHKKEIESYFSELEKKEKEKRNDLEHLLNEQKSIFLISPLASMMMIHLIFIQMKIKENEIKKKFYLEKLQEINNNFVEYKNILDKYSFVENKEFLYEQFFSPFKNLQKIKEEQDIFLQNIEEQINEVKQQQQEEQLRKERENLAIKTAFKLIANNKINKQNAILTANYLSKKFDIDFSIDNLIDVKNFLLKFEDEKLINDKISFADIKNFLEKTEKTINFAREI